MPKITFGHAFAGLIIIVFFVAVVLPALFGQPAH